MFKKTCLWQVFFTHRIHNCRKVATCTHLHPYGGNGEIVPNSKSVLVKMLFFRSFSRLLELLFRAVFRVSDGFWSMLSKKILFWPFLTFRPWPFSQWVLINSELPTPKMWDFEPDSNLYHGFWWILTSHHLKCRILSRIAVFTRGFDEFWHPNPWNVGFWAV